MQETAQLLGGEALPRMLLQGILTKSKVPSDQEQVALINLTVYDGWIERVCRRWKEQEGKFHFKTLSMTKTTSIGQFVEKTLALELLEEPVAPFSKLVELKF